MAVMAESVGAGYSDLGRLEPVDPRSIWPHEVLNFTPWLALNADRLAEALGIELELDATEHPSAVTRSTSSARTKPTASSSSWKTSWAIPITATSASC